MSNKISMCLYDFQSHLGDRAAIEIAKKIGADGIDYSLYVHDVRKEGDLYTLGRDAVIEYYTELKQYADLLGIEFSQTHGRLYGFGMSPEEDEAFVRNSELDMLATRILGAKYCVVHTPPVGWIGPDKTSGEMFDINSRMFSSILPFAKREDVKVAAETHGYCRKYECMEFFGYIENLVIGCDNAKSDGDFSDSLCVCVDTGHTNMTVRHGFPTVGDAIRMLGDRVEVLHLHDNDGVTDQHKIPMTGTVDWADVFAALSEIGYSGWYNLENTATHFGEGFALEEAKFSIKVLRQMLNIYKKN